MILNILSKVAIDIIAVTILSYFIYYKRYKDKSLFASSMMLNVFVFSVLSIISDGDIALQAGLGLFAILSILRFRSENFDKMDMVYFFGSIALAAVNGIATLGPMLYLSNGLILIVAFVVDSNLISPRTQVILVELDQIPTDLYSEDTMRGLLTTKFDFVVHQYKIISIDCVKETVTIEMEHIV